MAFNFLIEKAKEAISKIFSVYCIQCEYGGKFPSENRICHGLICGRYERNLIAVGHDRYGRIFKYR